MKKRSNWGTTFGTIGATGLLTPPAATSSQQTGTITATSTDDATKSGSATFTVPAATVQPVPATGYGLAVSPISVDVNSPVTVTATLTGGTALTSTLTITLVDSLASTGTKTITIANGSTSGVTILTPTAAGTHGITATHTGGGFTGNDGSASFTANAAVTTVRWQTSATGLAAGLVGGTTAGFGFRVATNGGAYGSLVTTGIVADPDAPDTYVATFNLAAGLLPKIKWASGSGEYRIDATPITAPLTTVGSITVQGGATLDEIGPLLDQKFAAQNAIDPTPLITAFVASTPFKDMIAASVAPAITAAGASGRPHSRPCRPPAWRPCSPPAMRSTRPRPAMP